MCLSSYMTIYKYNGGQCIHYYDMSIWFIIMFDICWLNHRNIVFLLFHLYMCMNASNEAWPTLVVPIPRLFFSLWVSSTNTNEYVRLKKKKEKIKQIHLEVVYERSKQSIISAQDHWMMKLFQIQNKICSFTNEKRIHILKYFFYSYVRVQ